MNIIKNKSAGKCISMSVASMLMLSACGGGGGSSTSAATPPVSTLSAITAGNSAQVASNAYAANGAISNSSTGATSLLSGVSVGGATPGVVTPALVLVKRAYVIGAPALLTGASTTLACSGGGSIAVTGVAANSTGPANGDKISVTASHCVEGGTIVDGAFAMAFSGISGNVFGSGAGAATIDMTFTNFSVAEGTTTDTVSGDMKLVASQTAAGYTTLVISGASLQSVELKAGAKVSDVRMSDYSATVAGSGDTFSASASYAMSGTMGSLGQVSYTVRTLQPFSTGASGVPSAGSLTVSGAASSVTATVIPANNVRLDYSAKGDGVITQTTTVDWATFALNR